MTPVHRPEDVTADWLRGVLGCGPITSVQLAQIGTGQMSENHRVLVTYANPDEPAPSSFVLKVAASDETSRATGLALGLYEREVRFYREVAPLLNGPLAPCHHASFDPATGLFALLLDDASPAVQGDEIAGCTPEDARIAMAELGRLHGPALGDEQLASAEWLNRESPINQAIVEGLLAGFVERYAERIRPEHRAVAQSLVASFDASMDEQLNDPDTVRGLIHGDYRLDNLLFGTAGAARPLTVVDWQTVTWGPAMTDVAYFLGCALTTEDRRAHAGELLEIYREALGPDAPITREQILDGVRRQSFFGVLMAVISPMLVQQTERGDDMFMALFERHCQHVLDLDALETLPAPESQVPLVPEPEDEGFHPPGAEPLWNESWYFDVADPDQGIGAWVRLGVDPAKGTCWATTLICGPGRPTVAFVDFAAPAPGDDLRVRAFAFASGQVCEEPLRRYRVTVLGTALSYDDPAALLYEGEGVPVEAELDLVWETAGTPYQYRLATRYEIPCRVSGTLRVGDETITIAGAPGQRDHSWGARDWWAMDWVWSAAHLDDGTHLHGVDLRIPGAPRLGAGYVQDPDGTVTEISAAPADERLAANGLGATTVQTIGGVEATFEPLGHGPLRLVADDGRVALFPRAWGTVTTADGRSGTGWIEWNLNH
ncbi:MAG: phosphotransferase [Solirubrobacteraceae bacterium]|nr:phosphotransferase [Solirubrobacteraceae bacterium]